MSHWFWPAFQREIRSSWKKLFLAAVTLCIGMTALTALLLADARLEAQTRRQADSILGGDAEVSDVRLLPENFLDGIQDSAKIARKSRITSFVSMASFTPNSRARLSEILAIDDSYPLVPGLRVQPKFTYETLRSGAVLIEKSLADTHGLQAAGEKSFTETSEKALQKLLGERKALRIGKRIFPIAGLVENDQSRDFASFSLGSRIYMARDVAIKLNLISLQSRLRDRLLIQFPAQGSIEWLRSEISKIDSFRPAVRTKEDALNAAFKPARSLFLFFNAIGFAALLLLGLGSAQGIHSYLKRKQADAQILSNLGAPRSLLTLLYVGNVLLVLALALSLGAWFGQILFQNEISSRLNQWFTGSAADVTIVSNSAIAFKFALASFLLILSLILPGALSYLRRTPQRPSILNVAAPNDPLIKKIVLRAVAVLENFPDLVWLLTALLLSFLISNETAFNLLLVVVLTGLYLAIRVVVLLVSRLGLSPNISLPLSLRLAGSEIAARPSQSALSLLLFGLSVCLLVFLWDLRSNIVGQITSVTSGNLRPNVFVLDAPADAMAGIEKILSTGQKEKNILSERITRARLASINSKSTDEWLSQFREGSEEYTRAQRLLNREQNLTSRATLLSGDDAEEVIDGQFWKKDSAGSALNEVSLETGLAKNLNLKLGDTLIFDVQGVPVSVKVTSLRRVRWQSFRPNFFFVMHPSTLQDAPYSGILAVNIADPQQRLATVNAMFDNHPGITTIDASELAAMATKLLNAALEIVRFLTILLFAGGMLNTILSAWTSFSLRAQNFSLYRCLGANNSLVLRAIFGEFLLLSVAGCAIGMAASWLLSMMVQKTILTVDDQLNIAVLPGFTIAAAIITICCAAAFVSAVLILRQAPFRVLRRPA